MNVVMLHSHYRITILFFLYHVKYTIISNANLYGCMGYRLSVYMCSTVYYMASVGGGRLSLFSIIFPAISFAPPSKSLIPVFLAILSTRDSNPPAPPPAPAPALPNKPLKVNLAGPTLLQMQAAMIKNAPTYLSLSFLLML